MARGTAIILLLVCAIATLAVQSARQHQRHLDAALRELNDAAVARAVALVSADDALMTAELIAGAGTTDRSIDRSLEVRVPLEPLLVEPQQRS